VARKWSRARQVALEKPAQPIIPPCCLQCGSRHANIDQDGDLTCTICGRLLVCWSRYRWELSIWRKGKRAREQTRGGRAA
jgi:hypothetical protein